MKCSPNVPRIPTCWFPLSNNTSDGSGAHHEWSLPAGFYSLKNEKIIQEMGVTRVAVPHRNGTTPVVAVRGKLGA